jgi:hypothetical protein
MTVFFLCSSLGVEQRGKVKFRTLKNEGCGTQEQFVEADQSEMGMGKARDLGSDRGYRG